jgi:hypothetical protein
MLGLLLVENGLFRVDTLELRNFRDIIDGSCLNQDLCRVCCEAEVVGLLMGDSYTGGCTACGCCSKLSWISR